MVSSAEMKILSLVRVLALSAVIVLPPLAVAQNADEDTSAPAAGRGGRGHHKYLANLTPAERKELKAAKAKAKQDPSYQAAKVKMREAREAMRAALLKADPAIQPILNKIPEGGHQRNS
jgi:Spy/CpxP family protein refolding chaperone